MNQKYALKKQFPLVCKKAGLPHGRNVEGGLIFHDLRRSAKTYMMLAGVDKVLRDAMLGHQPTGMDRHYIVVNDETLTAAMNKYVDWLDSQLESANVDQTVDQKVFENLSN